MINNNEDVITAQSYNDCIRKCLRCGIGYSNAKYNPKIIYKNIEDNIANEIKDKNIEDIINKSLNIRNRPTKLNKAKISTSEDALTYSFMKYLIESNQITKLIKIIDSTIKEFNNIEVYLWGVNIVNNNIEKIETLKTILVKKYKENLNSLSEPDIIITGDTFTIIIEVKYKSPNEVKNTNSLHKYIRNNFYDDLEKAIECEHYELIRNWTILNELEEDNAILVNLGDIKLFNDKNKLKLEYFEKSLNQNNKRKFIKLKWEELFHSDIYFSDTMKKYLKKKFFKITTTWS